MTVVSIIRVRRKATGKHTRMDTVMYGELVVPAFNYFYQFCNSDKKNVHVLKGLHCKNMWVVLTQLGSTVAINMRVNILELKLCACTLQKHESCFSPLKLQLW